MAARIDTTHFTPGTAGAAVDACYAQALAAKVNAAMRSALTGGSAR